MNKYLMLCMVLNLKNEFEEDILVGKPTNKQTQVIKRFNKLIQVLQR